MRVADGFGLKPVRQPLLTPGRTEPRLLTNTNARSANATPSAAVRRPSPSTVYSNHSSFWSLWTRSAGPQSPILTASTSPDRIPGRRSPRSGRNEGAKVRHQGILAPQATCQALCGLLALAVRLGQPDALVRDPLLLPAALPMRGDRADLLLLPPALPRIAPVQSRKKCTLSPTLSGEPVSDVRYSIPQTQVYPDWAVNGQALAGSSCRAGHVAAA